MEWLSLLILNFMGNEKNIIIKITIVAIILLPIFSVLHLMYGNCQTSNMHYMVQCFYVPRYLPECFWVSNYSEIRSDGVNELRPYKDFKGKWYVIERSHWEDGTLSNEIYGVKDISDYLAYNQDSLKPHGIKTCYYQNGKMECQTFYINGIKNGQSIKWYDSGNIKSINNYKDGVLLSTKSWNLDGSKN